ncbi:MAG: rhomboid family intramembrane serine protease [Pseudomonadota bacterium]
MDMPAAPATLILLAVNIIVSISALTFASGLLPRYAFNVGALAFDKQHYRVFTSSFLHGDYLHLAFNMLTLWFFGPTVEGILGTDGFLVVYFGAVLVSGIVSFYVNRKKPDYSSIGASDAVSGVVLSFCLFFPMTPLYIFFIPIGIPAILYGVLFMLISANLLGRTGNRIAHEGHLGGALAGVLLTILMEPGVLTRWFG